MIAGAFQFHQVCVRLREHADRRDAWEAARAESVRVGRPLLNIGCGSTQWLPTPCGDVCLDSDPRRLANCQASDSRVGDVRAIPYPDHSFGAAVACHVLEHLPTVADGELALAELHRVALVVYVVSPGGDYVGNWLTPDHYLWVNHGPDGTITFEQRARGVAAGEPWYPALEAYWRAKENLEIAATTGRFP